MREDKTLEKFGAIMDEIIENEEIVMQVRIPEKSRKPEIIDNTGMGPVMQFYIALNILPVILKSLAEMVGGIDAEPMLDEMFRMLKEETLEELNEDGEDTGISASELIKE